MPLNPDIVGTKLVPVEVALTQRMTLAFAAGIDEVVELEERAANASPLQAVALEWRLVIAAGHAHLGLDGEARLRIVHAGQSSRFPGTLHAGRTYRVEAEITGAYNSSAGGVVETTMTTCDAETNEIVVETVSTALCRGSDFQGKPTRVRQRPAPRQFDGEIALPIDRWLPHRYTECSGIWNPIHTEPAIARAASLPGIIVHGTATWALAGKAIAAHFADTHTGVLEALSGRFTGMAFPGSMLRLHYVSPSSDGAIVFAVVDAQGSTVIADGEARLRS